MYPLVQRLHLDFVVVLLPDHVLLLLRLCVL
jgi:hypothetical protein